jgi:hypothetical protein
MITIVYDGQEIELEDLEHARWALDAVQMSMEDGARGMEGWLTCSRTLLQNVNKPLTRADFRLLFLQRGESLSSSSSPMAVFQD